jgi:predicted amidohydrolase
MKVALASNQITADIDQNLRNIIEISAKAASGGVDLILFPEMAVTGMINNDDPAHDFPLALDISSPIILRLKELSSRLNIWLGIGFLEREGRRLYDSAILLSPSGEGVLHYRRIDPHWHGAKADPSIYCQGNVIKTAVTPLGKFAFLICGDLFDNTIISRLRGQGIDWLLFPFARCFDDKSIDQKRWDNCELEQCRERVKATAITTLMANYLAGVGIEDDGSFGGAFAVNKDGRLIAGLPLGTPGVLIVDF